MITNLKSIKRTKFWSIIIDYLCYPIYHFIWSYIINFNGKFLYFLWSLKNKDSYSLNRNDKLLVGSTTEFKNISKEILDETKGLVENSRKIICSHEYSNDMKKTNYASGKIPYRISLYEKLSPSLQSKIVKFASSPKMVTTAANYMGVFPILTRVQVSLNIPRENSKLRGAMFWHKDGLGFKNLDFFMCVTDLDETNGPFYCLEEKIQSGIFKSFDFYFKETGERNKVPLEVFDKKFKDKKIIKLEGESGTGIFLDSFSTYHRGGFCEKNDRIMLRLCYQTQDAICDTFDNHDNLYPFDKSISLNNTNNIFEKFLFFKKPFFIVKMIKNLLIKAYYLIEFKYRV